MAEGFLADLTDDYLQSCGYLTLRNVRIPVPAGYGENDGPSRSASMDILAVNPTLTGLNRVIVASCDTTTGAFDPGKRLDELKVNNKVPHGPFWSGRRELWSRPWGQELLDVVETLTTQRSLKYYLVTNRVEPSQIGLYDWQSHPRISHCLEGSWIGFLGMQELVSGHAARDSVTEPSPTRQAARVLESAGYRPIEAGEDLSGWSPRLDTDTAHSSIAGMYEAPRVAMSLDEIGRYGNGVNGYDIAAGDFRVEAGPDGLRRLVQELTQSRPPHENWMVHDLPNDREAAGGQRPPFDWSFEQARLVQFYQVRAWHFGGWPETEEYRQCQLALHAHICEAWADTRFDHPRPRSKTTR
jgi:hypothetical protein